MLQVMIDQPQSVSSAGPSGLRRVELLAPAGDWECARAAVENGADAIYFGLERFNARMRAHNFTEADLPKLMEFLHSRGVRGYVTFNTLVFADEMAGAEQYLRSIIRAGVDAAIVQDVGVCRMIRAISKDFPIHASTQMTITSEAGVEFARALGCNLVVLARECSMAEIEKIRAADGAGEQQMPLEVFVHGALCVAYSGQCLTSEALGGRSANRGECAQACRMPYDLISDGRKVDLGDRKYLLSPQDLAGIEVLPGIIGSGVASLKIEGRLKTPEYVANITRVYRAALDRLQGEASQWVTPQEKYDLEMGFSRGLYTGWFRGIHNQELAHARFGKKRGVYLGDVVRLVADGVVVRLDTALKAGDGVVFDAGRPEDGEEGGRVYTIDPLGRGNENKLRFGDGAVNWSRVLVGQKVWKTSDPELDKRLRQTFEGEKIRFQRPVEMEVHGLAGSPLTVTARDGEGHIASVESSMALAKAENQPLDAARLEAQLGRLGGTPFRLGKLISRVEGEVVLPVSELNRMRRELAAELERQRRAPLVWDLSPERLSPPIVRMENWKVPADLSVMVRSMEQLNAALALKPESIYAEFEDPKKYREAVALAHAQGQELWVAQPRITKMGEEWILKQVRSCDADGYLVRNYDHLRFFGDQRRRGDFSFNVANPWSAAYFLEQEKLERITVSYDLNAEQVEAFLKFTAGDRVEIVLHQHMPMFHMEHCVFCAFLSKGKDYRDCGRPCDDHVVKLRDRVGAEHPLKADAGCRNTVFNSQAQSGAEYASRFMELGARHFRVEFLLETAAEVTKTLQQYQQLIRGEVHGANLWRDLRAVNQLGVTRGQLAGKPRSTAVSG